MNPTDARTGLALLRAATMVLVAALSAPLAAEQALRIDVDTSALPRLGSTPREQNPYRDDAKAVEVGAAAFQQACARCHALATSGGIGPDLRMLNASCRRIADETRRNACMRDQDHYFLKSVLEGKVIVGVRQMPAWRDFLSQEAIWAMRSYIESREPWR